MLIHNQTMQRPGAVLPLTALLMVVILGMAAFAVDTGWITVAQSELQNAADSAALAGVTPLMDGYVQYKLATTDNVRSTILTSALSSARTIAKQYAGYNAAGGVKSLVLNDSDIEFGFLDASNTYSSTYSGFPNTIKVVIRRDSTANQSLPLFFGPVLGTKSVALSATASATIYTGTINSFNASGINTGMLPMTYDVNHWNAFLSNGKGPDGTSMTDGNNIPELQVYPSVKYKGNFGQLSLDDSHVGQSTESNWVTNGMSTNDIQALQNSNLIPLSQHNASKWDWQGDTGFKASLVMTVNDQVGKTYLLPLFKPSDASSSSYKAGVGQGANYNYNIVQFVGIRIMASPDYNGSVIVQPAAVRDPNAVFDSSSIVPAGTSSTLVTTFTTPKLTR